MTPISEFKAVSRRISLKPTLIRDNRSHSKSDILPLLETTAFRRARRPGRDLGGPAASLRAVLHLLPQRRPQACVPREAVRPQATTHLPLWRQPWLPGLHLAAPAPAGPVAAEQTWTWNRRSARAARIFPRSAGPSRPLTPSPQALPALPAPPTCNIPDHPMILSLQVFSGLGPVWRRPGHPRRTVNLLPGGPLLRPPEAPRTSPQPEPEWVLQPLSILLSSATDEAQVQPSRRRTMAVQAGGAGTRIMDSDSSSLGFKFEFKFHLHCRGRIQVP